MLSLDAVDVEMFNGNIKALFKTVIIRLKGKEKGADHRVNKGKH